MVNGRETGQEDTTPAYLGVEFGSTRIKACLIGAANQPIATGSSVWRSRIVDGFWTYDLGDVWSGLQGAVANVLARASAIRDSRPLTLREIGVSGMMHGYLAFNQGGDILVPFRTWRNVSTLAAASELSEALNINIPQRWSIAHLYQAILDGEDHVQNIDYITTLAGYVHWRLTGCKVLGIGDASGMFPISTFTLGYDQRAMRIADDLFASHGFHRSLASLLPTILTAGSDAGSLTESGAELLTSSKSIGRGIRFCPPEGDATTGMVATQSIIPRTGNVSVGTSIFATTVLERPLRHAYPEIDVISTPTGSPAAMIHCNNGADEIGAWASVFLEFAGAIGQHVDLDRVFEVLLEEALSGESDGGGVLALSHVSGEAILDNFEEGRPIVVRTPESRLTLANLSRALVHGVFGTLSLGMRMLAQEGVGLDTMYAHGGLFRTAGAAQRLLAAAIGAPVAVHRSASEGGAWGIAVLAAYAATGHGVELQRYLAERVFTGDDVDRVDPDPEDMRGYARFLQRYEAGLAVERAAADVL